MALLAACSKPVPPDALPRLSEGEVRHFRLDRLDAQGNIAQSSVLLVQAEAQGRTRWIQTDAFGAPQARLTIDADGWQRNGFVPPNRDAQRLFEAMFPLLQDPDPKPLMLHGWRITPLENHE